VVQDAGAAIGAAVAGLAIAVNPQCVVIGGELAETGEILIGPMREAIRRRVPLNHIAPLEVVGAELGPQAEVMGAVLLVLESTHAPTHWFDIQDGD
jgi:predicted NBD/HSP70 family sugar kinase